MFAALRSMMQARREARQAQTRAQQRLQLALLRQAQAAATVRQLALVDSLARSWLPRPLRLAVVAVLQRRLAALPIHSAGSPKSTASSVKTGKRSTSKRRRAR